MRKDGVIRGKTVTAVINRVQFKSTEHRHRDLLMWAMSSKKSVYIYIYVFIHHTKPLMKLSMFQLPVKIFEYLKPAIAL